MIQRKLCPLNMSEEEKGKEENKQNQKTKQRTPKSSAAQTTS